MEYNERLMNEALHGDKYSFKELYSNAGSGSAVAQYYLAMYYAKANGGEHDPDYQYWMEKAVKNGYVPGVGEVHNLTDEQLEAIENMKASNIARDFWGIMKLFSHIF